LGGGPEAVIGCAIAALDPEEWMRRIIGACLLTRTEADEDRWQGNEEMRGRGFIVYLYDAMKKNVCSGFEDNRLGLAKTGIIFSQKYPSVAS
jgi:hypothetical protein